MSLSKISRRPLRNTVAIFGLRHASDARGLPPTAPKQLSTPGESGFFSYSRNWSRDKKYNLDHAPQKGDTPLSFLVRRLGHAYEVYPLIVLCSAWVVLFAFTGYWSFDKAEIWLNRGNDSAPWSWERVRDNYWKQNTLVFDPEGVTHKRLEIMEILQDQMLEAAGKRGTR
ncbi:hypothetical protein PMAYCL1PPCAC_16077, partial [Pristionchus mayeri]